MVSILEGFHCNTNKGLIVLLEHNDMLSGPKARPGFLQVFHNIYLQKATMYNSRIASCSIIITAALGLLFIKWNVQQYVHTGAEFESFSKIIIKAAKHNFEIQ